ncbi:Myosin heavy chain, muscle [Nymphon striatum]|nr:Myosin heavy chain, muscle [Nymphon striatum]
MGVEEDPDPTEFLYVSLETKRKDQTKPYDGKKMVWVPSEKEGHVLGDIKSTKGDLVTVDIPGGEKVFNKRDVQQVNPPKFEMCEDMASLTYLNDASVLHNLKSRYYQKFIYTYSGLFCVAINPYKRYPIYTNRVVQIYKGKRRNEVPPHIFAISDGAYTAMLQICEAQRHWKIFQEIPAKAVLIGLKEHESKLSRPSRGESGAGKTENTKKVLAYFANVGAVAHRKGDKKEAKKANLEDQVVQTNPVLEAFGNAKTVRNDNSSRFGKFIRIHFGDMGKLAGADIETYLLEKARVISQQPLERSYHIFYQMMSGYLKDLKGSIFEIIISQVKFSNGYIWLLARLNESALEMCLLDDDIKKYHFVSQGKTEIPNVDDNEEFGLTDTAFDILGFTQQEKDDIYRVVASVMHLGEMKFKQRPREEQAEADGTEEGEKIAHILGIAAADLYKNLLKPRIKVGNEFVTQGRTKDQVIYSIGAMSKAMYDRTFKWLVKRVNETLDTKQKRQHFIGVLDIAGFEIFDFNGFEQICINFTNEKLQQFFNHHMFVLEQEEYKREGIEWQFIDFGMDLQACIDLIEKRLQQFFNHHMFVLEQEEYKKEGIHWDFIDFGMDLQACIELMEKPMGVFSILEEESMFPKATDKTFEEKLKTNHLGKSPNFQKPKPAKAGQVEAHFSIGHYAGTVPYNLTGWLEKNKDPLNDSVVDQFKKGKNKLLGEIFIDHPGQSGGGDDGSKKGGRKKGGGFATEQLNKLMKTLHETSPHFIRCIIPNETKSPGVIDSHLVMHQLTCNGVLEGIRICRKGFPNRMVYPDFKHRYIILAPNAVPKGFSEAKGTASKILEAIELEDSQYKIVPMFVPDPRYAILAPNCVPKGFVEAQKITEKLLQAIDLEDSQYRIGKTKVFFRAGVLGQLEELRDERLGKIMAWLQSWIRGYLCRKEFKKLQDQRLALTVIQRNLRKYLQLRNWQWWKLYAKVGFLLRRHNLLLDLLVLLLLLLQYMSSVFKTYKYSFAFARLQVKPLLNVARIEDELKKLEDDLKKAKEALEKEEKLRKQLEDQNVKILQEKNDLFLQLESERGASGDQEERTQRLMTQKSDLESQVSDLQDRLSSEEDSKGSLQTVKKKLDNELSSMKKDVEDLELTIQKAEQDKSTKDHQLRNLNDEIAHQDELINKLNKEKKHLQEVNQKTAEDLQATEDKVNHLNKVKSKLEQTLDELEDSLEREKKVRGDVEKTKRKIEGELKLAQEAIADLEKNKKEMEQALQRKDKEISSLQGKLEDEQSLVAKLQKQIKELQARIEELEEELEAERQARAKAEKQRADLARELEELSERLEEAGGATSAQIELNKKREAEMAKLRRDLEESSVQHEAIMTALRKKHNDSVAEMSDQVEQLNKVKAKLDKEKFQNKAEADDLKASMDHVNKEKVQTQLLYRHIDEKW